MPPSSSLATLSSFLQDLRYNLHAFGFKFLITIEQISVSFIVFFLKIIVFGKVPADCKIVEGTVEIDQSSLTGESLPITVYKGESCKMGATVARGEVEGIVLSTGANTFFGRTASLLQVLFLNPINNISIFIYYYYLFS